MIRILTFLLLVHPSFAQQNLNAVSGRHFQRIYTRENVDIFSTSANQASLASIKNLAFGIYCEQRFLLKDVNFLQSVMGFTTAAGSFNTTFKYCGNPYYHESLAGFGYGRKLTDIIDAGLQFDMLFVGTQNYGRARAFSFQGGLLFHFNERLHAGIHLDHPYAATMETKNMGYWPSVYTVGLGYAASENCFISAELQQEEDRQTSFNSSIQYAINRQWMMRAGISSSGPFWFMGAAFSFPGYRFDVGFSLHPYAGTTPGAGLIYHVKNRQ